MKRPDTISVKELAKLADRAAEKADVQARRAGIEVAGLERRRARAAAESSGNKSRSKVA